MGNVELLRITMVTLVSKMGQEESQDPSSPIVYGKFSVKRHSDKMVFLIPLQLGEIGRFSSCMKEANPEDH